jgi:hypothetical protein
MLAAEGASRVVKFAAAMLPQTHFASRLPPITPGSEDRNLAYSFSRGLGSSPVPNVLGLIRRVAIKGQSESDAPMC